MKQYLLSIYQPDGPTPPREFLDEVMRGVYAVEAEMKAAGAWVFSGGLHPPTSSTVVHAKPGAEPLLTDGPYMEGKEHLGGFTIIRAADLDAALDWAKKLARVLPLPIEVRPFHDSK